MNGLVILRKARITLLCEYYRRASLTIRISSSHLYRSSPGFVLPCMGYPFRDLPNSRVALFRSISECVSLAYEHARRS